jgi:phytoene dehydrogenase-like protein
MVCSSMVATASAKEQRKFDVIVIGSGIGGLTCASLLAQFYKKRVLLIEKHFKFGGYSHSFQRPGGYSWDVGLHYVGQMGKRDQLRLVMDKVTGSRVEWQQFPDPFQHAVFPGFKIPFYSDEARHKQTLIDSFPQSQTVIERYFRDVRKATRSGMIASIVSRLPGPAALILRLLFGHGTRFAMQTTQSYFDKHIADPKLQAVLDAQWGDYGLPPQQSTFFMHATIVQHYWNGAYRPFSGAQSISDAVVAIVNENGGETLKATQASQLIFNQGRVVGVRAHKTNHPEESSEFFAPIVISDAGAKETYLKLVPMTVPMEFREALRAITPGCTAINLYVALRKENALNTSRHIYWIFADWDHNRLWESRSKLLEGAPQVAFVSFDTNTAQIVTFIDSDFFSAWNKSQWKDRPADYEALKVKIAESLIDCVGHVVHGFREAIAYYEVATPLTYQFFANRDHGEIYGLSFLSDFFSKPWTRPRSPFKGLFLTGADIGGVGIAGAMMSGVITLAQICGIRIYRQVFKRPR